MSREFSDGRNNVRVTVGSDSNAFTFGDSDFAFDVSGVNLYPGAPKSKNKKYKERD